MDRYTIDAIKRVTGVSSDIISEVYSAIGKLNKLIEKTEDVHDTLKDLPMSAVTPIPEQIQTMLNKLQGIYNRSDLHTKKNRDRVEELKQNMATEHPSKLNSLMQEIQNINEQTSFEYGVLQTVSFVVDHFGYELRFKADEKTHYGTWTVSTRRGMND